MSAVTVADTHRSGWDTSRIPKNPAPATELVPGRTLRGINLSPSNADLSSGWAFRSMFKNWDWDGWIKPQIDKCAEVGANVVRLIGDIQGVNDGTFTQAHYAACWHQLTDYAWSKGMYTYLTGGGVSQVGTLTPTQVGDTLAALGTDMESRKEAICGFDLLQESAHYSVPNAAVISPIVRSSTTIPITWSVNGHTRASVLDLERSVLDPHVDFWDIHVYHQPSPYLMHDAFWGLGHRKPVLIGEYGLPTGQGTPAQEARYRAVAEIANNHVGGVSLAGVLVWAIIDQSATDQGTMFGLYDQTWSPRPNLIDLYRSLPMR